MSRIKDLISQVFDKLTVIEFFGCKNNRAYWVCNCSCGNTKIVAASHLIEGAIGSCGCIRKEKIINYNKKSKIKTNVESAAWKGCGEISLTYFNVVKVGAAKRDLEFSITIEDAWNQFILQNRKCALSGVELKFKTSRNINDGTASLDRIDSLLGYTIDNIQWLHKEVNLMKQHLPENKFIKWCQLIIQNKKAE